MYGIFAYIWVIYRANVSKYSIHGAYGYGYAQKETMPTYESSQLGQLGSPVKQFMYVCVCARSHEEGEQHAKSSRINKLHQQRQRLTPYDIIWYSVYYILLL